MSASYRTAAGLAVLALALAGCTTTRMASQGAESSPTATVGTSPAATATPLADPSAASADPSTVSADPSATARMICGPEIQGSVRQALALPSLTPPTSSWRDQLYSCVYRLPMGPMTLSVKQSASDAAAMQYFTKLRPTFGQTADMIGLGQASYGTSTGIVTVVKDDKTLVVDASRLPVVFGSQQQKRTDLAYEIASDVLGCWTGNDYGSTVSPSGGS